MKQLTRSKNKKVLGVAGGIAEYFRLDPTLIRTIWGVATILGIGSPILLYLAMAIIIPESTDY